MLVLSEVLLDACVGWPAKEDVIYAAAVIMPVALRLAEGGRPCGRARARRDGSSIAARKELHVPQVGGSQLGRGVGVHSRLCGGEQSTSNARWW